MPTLEEDEIRALIAGIDRMVPADDFPSASQAGCLDFLLRIIELEDLREVYKAGLTGLQIEASAFGAAFADLTPDVQDRILKRMEKSRTAVGWSISPAKFIELLARQTIEGYYADSGNGGNRDGISWQMVGFKVKG